MLSLTGLCTCAERGLYVVGCNQASDDLMYWKIRPNKYRRVLSKEEVYDNGQAVVLSEHYKTGIIASPDSNKDMSDLSWMHEGNKLYDAMLSARKNMDALDDL